MARIEIRITRVEKFISYLIEQEKQEFIDYNLDLSEIKFTEKLKINVDKQISIVRKSAMNKKRTEDDNY